MMKMTNVQTRQVPLNIWAALFPIQMAMGLNDELDKCPNQAGLKELNGCADTDRDGIIDDMDKCPTVAGVAAYEGCPIPDRDMDGILDPDDKCPDIKGPADNGGCPKIENAKFNTQFIQFVSGKAILTAKSKELIKEGAKLLNSEDFKMLKVEVRGHTDNTGGDELNMKLSQDRANAVMAELVKNGVAIFSYHGCWFRRDDTNRRQQNS